jgi:hypothetical protein
MATVADTIQAKFTASWSAGTQPTGYASSDWKTVPTNVAEWIYYVEYMEQVYFKRSTKGFDKKTVTLPIECYTRTDKDRLDAIAAEIRSLCIDLCPGTYDDVSVSRFDMSKSSRERKVHGALVYVQVTTFAEAR